jgi:hypothetical protein
LPHATAEKLDFISTQNGGKDENCLVWTSSGERNYTPKIITLLAVESFNPNPHCLSIARALLGSQPSPELLMLYKLKTFDVTYYSCRYAHALIRMSFVWAITKKCI